MLNSSSCSFTSTSFLTNSQ